jgi:hypothetical protein
MINSNQIRTVPAAGSYVQRLWHLLEQQSHNKSTRAAASTNASGWVQITTCTIAADAAPAAAWIAAQ